ncbi:hypothetical protein [Terrimonas pollutisoli]|uniref:hypothetical protein n=1 Tax=Terrimonas pollutisoli TaxID=3034147 RepID=UPI0023EA9D0D|nr:hypothetical protein [Terrimonas sp. H1YJ31]
MAVKKFFTATQIKGDTVFAYHSNLVYNGYITKLNEEDFFVKHGELVFTKAELKAMLDKDEINAVERNYGTEVGFDRIR